MFNWPGMIFQPIGFIASIVLPKWIYKPVCGCVVCMASFWTLMYCFTICQDLMGWHLLWLMCAVAGSNAIIICLIPKITDDDLEGDTE